MPFANCVRSGAEEGTFPSTERWLLPAQLRCRDATLPSSTMSARLVQSALHRASKIAEDGANTSQQHPTRGLLYAVGTLVFWGFCILFSELFATGSLRALPIGKIFFRWRSASRARVATRSPELSEIQLLAL